MKANPVGGGEKKTVNVTQMFQKIWFWLWGEISTNTSSRTKASIFSLSWQTETLASWPHWDVLLWQTFTVLSVEFYLTSITLLGHLPSTKALNNSSYLLMSWINACVRPQDLSLSLTHGEQTERLPHHVPSKAPHCRGAVVSRTGPRFVVLCFWQSTVS